MSQWRSHSRSLEHDRLSGWPLGSINLFYGVVAILTGLALLGMRSEVVMLKQVICFGIFPSPQTRISRNLSNTFTTRPSKAHFQIVPFPFSQLPKPQDWLPRFTLRRFHLLCEREPAITQRNHWGSHQTLKAVTYGCAGCGLHKAPWPLKDRGKEGIAGISAGNRVHWHAGFILSLWTHGVSKQSGCNKMTWGITLKVGPLFVFLIILKPGTACFHWEPASHEGALSFNYDLWFIQHLYVGSTWQAFYSYNEIAGGLWYSHFTNEESEIRESGFLMPQG